ncbi:hypothetical protein J6590_039062 [Homalodisca vitripennis]|nr:hypothetical protein J6590_039062 [Homalodisca vitripennis]
MGGIYGQFDTAVECYIMPRRTERHGHDIFNIANVQLLVECLVEKEYLRMSQSYSLNSEPNICAHSGGPGVSTLHGQTEGLLSQ